MQDETKTATRKPKLPEPGGSEVEDEEKVHCNINRVHNQVQKYIKKKDRKTINKRKTFTYTVYTFFKRCTLLSKTLRTLVFANFYLLMLILSVY